MTKLTKRVVDNAEVQGEDYKDYVVWDDERPGFGLRVFKPGKRSYLIRYRSAGRSRRRSEIIGLKWSEVDAETSCLRLADSKEGASIRPIGLPVVEFMEARRRQKLGAYVVPGVRGRQRLRQFSKSLGAALQKIPLPDVSRMSYVIASLASRMIAGLRK